jgi:MoaA/NifB/PqqE/SkfB family radical SAM enzyme
MDKNKINKHFCIQPFVNVTVDNRGAYSMCCETVLNKRNNQHHGVKQFFNSDQVMNVRKQLLAGNKILDCKNCQLSEQQNKNSHRIEYNNIYHIKNNQSHEYYENAVKKLRAKELEFPRHVELHISNLCNLKCLTCGEETSSQFHAENKKLGISQYPSGDFTRHVVDSMETLKSAIHPGLITLNMRGGETLMVPELKENLANVPKDIAQNITLKIETNGTQTPDDKWLSIFKKFKKLVVNISVDAYKSDNHYVRYPSSWEKIEQTIAWFEKHNYKFTINTVVSNINILILDKLLKWIQDNGYRNYCYVLSTPKYYAPTNLPKRMLQMAWVRLKKLSKNYENPRTAHHVDELIEMCNNTNKLDENLWNTFKKQIKMRDAHRGVNITSVVPEFEQYFE